MAEYDRDFKGVWIPKEVWLDNRLTALDKVILTEIDSLDQSERGCYASNKHIAEFCQCSEAKVSKSISLLIKLGYIYLQHFDGRQRELKSRFTKNNNLPNKIYKADCEKVEESNTYSKTKNNTDNIIYIVNYLNEKAGTSYRAKSKATQQHINARLSEGYTVEDFKIVIDKQCAKWKGTEYEEYLRPSTLFGTKFENYLNAKVTKQPTKQPEKEPTRYGGTYL